MDPHTPLSETECLCVKLETGRSVTTELRSCVKVEMAVLGSPSLIILIVSVSVKQHLKNRALELCECRGGRPGLPVHNSAHGFGGRKATLNWNSETTSRRLNKLTSRLPRYRELRRPHTETATSFFLSVFLSFFLSSSFSYPILPLPPPKMLIY